ncbi:hypothetical protein BDZ45DRAFT_783004 [Acephala macrosclerotiorum]|nr:hypothetical protein BDZ45DRAFT_783004 [Acephala macrosclerotiorum]
MEQPSAEIIAQRALQWDRDAVVEEFTLSLVHPDVMTLLQAERIQYFFDTAQHRNTTPAPSDTPTPRRVLEQALNLVLANDAMNNIPVQHMATWNTEQLQAQSFRLNRDAMEQDYFVLRAYIRLHEIANALTPEQQQTILTGLLKMTTRCQEGRQRDDEIQSLIFQRRNASLRFQRIQQRNHDRMAEQIRLGRKLAIAELLQGVSVSALPKDEDSHQCNICMGSYRSTESNYDGPEEVPVQFPCGHIYGKACISA